MLVVYLAHPIGEDISERGDNLSNAVEWFRFFINTTQWAIQAPWYFYTLAIGADIYGPRRMSDALCMLERSDVLVCCGGWMDEDVHAAIKRAMRIGMPVLDLTMMGVRPPGADEDVALQISNRVRKLIVTRPRRVWIPLLTVYDIETLKQARIALYGWGTNGIAGENEHDGAVRMIDRIISAAVDDGL